MGDSVPEDGHSILRDCMVPNSTQCPGGYPRREAGLVPGRGAAASPWTARGGWPPKEPLRGPGGRGDRLLAVADVGEKGVGSKTVVGEPTAQQAAGAMRRACPQPV